MPEYTFTIESAVTVYADTEEDAKRRLKSLHQDMDSSIGYCLVYYSDEAIGVAKLVEVYDPEKEAAELLQRAAIKPPETS
jgi:hypothetical protein